MTGLTRSDHCVFRGVERHSFGVKIGVHRARGTATPTRTTRRASSSRADGLATYATALALASARIGGDGGEPRGEPPGRVVVERHGVKLCPLRRGRPASASPAVVRRSHGVKYPAGQSPSATCWTTSRPSSVHAHDPAHGRWRCGHRWHVERRTSVEIKPVFNRCASGRGVGGCQIRGVGAVVRQPLKRS